MPYRTPSETSPDYSDIPGPWVVVNDHCQLREWGGASSTKRDYRNVLAVWAFTTASGWEWTVFAPSGGLVFRKGTSPMNEAAMRDHVGRALWEMDKTIQGLPPRPSRATVWDRLLLEDGDA